LPLPRAAAAAAGCWPMPAAALLVLLGPAAAAAAPPAPEEAMGLRGGCMCSSAVLKSFSAAASLAVHSARYSC
jgi:hypothetical protein